MFHGSSALCLHPCQQAERNTRYPVDRIWQHKEGLVPGFTKKYAVRLLVYIELHDTMPGAIKRERQIKEWKRAWKIELIESINPEWRDLYDDIWR
jgi:putative endonuclease